MATFNDVTLKPISESVIKLDITDSEYFSPLYSNYVSNSRLGLINPEQGGSPLLYEQNNNSFKSNALRIGSAIHELFLQPDQFYLSNQIKPTEKLEQVITCIFKLRKEGYTIYNACVQAIEELHFYYKNINTKINYVLKNGLQYYWYLKTNKNENEICLTTTERNKCLKCLKSLNDNKTIVSLVHPLFGKNYNEDAIFIDVEATLETEFDVKSCILKLKMKVDNWNIDVDNKIITLNDLKTTGKPINTFMEHSFVNFHYARQFGMYMWMLLQYCKQKYNYNSKDWTYVANVMVVETKNNFKSEAFQINQEMLNEGRKEFCSLLKRVAYNELNKNEFDLTWNE